MLYQEGKHQSPIKCITISKPKVVYFTAGYICHRDYSATLWKQAAFGTAKLNRITGNLQQFGFKCLSAGMFHVAVDKPLVCDVIHVTDHTLGFTRPSPTILVYWKPPNNAVRPVWKETCLERGLQLVETAVNDTC